MANKSVVVVVVVVVDDDDDDDDDDDFFTRLLGIGHVVWRYYVAHGKLIRNLNLENHLKVVKDELNNGQTIFNSVVKQKLIDLLIVRLTD